MRFSSIRLNWFRGAAAEAILEPKGGSLFVYGPNGAGKSSFVDAIEACVKGGKIAHLSHEYSGRHQEKGLINTHRPIGKTATVALTLMQTAQPVTCTWSGGAAKLSGLENTDLSTWDYRRIALRQEEVADFIRSTKAEKYSALVPLLGLQPLETAAENLRKVVRDIAALSNVDQLRAELAAVRARLRNVLPQTDDQSLQKRLDELHQQYLPSKTGQTFEDLLVVIDDRLNNLDAQSREAADLQKLSNNQLDRLIAAVRRLARQIVELAEPLVKERIGVLDAVATYSAGLEPEEHEVECPACGTMVRAEDFKAHIESERTRLTVIDELVKRHRDAIGILIDEIQRLRDVIVGRDLKQWIANQPMLAEPIRSMNQLNLSALRRSCSETDIQFIETQIGGIISQATSASVTTPTDIKDLIKDKGHAEALQQHFASEETVKKIKRVEVLIAFVGRVEASVRTEIRRQAERIFGAISGDIQRLWDMLHPGQKITDVRLNVPDEADKAIDVALRFYGVEQESPRLTLSEGLRNGLGLCIFLAMAKQGSSDGPIVLDDVVVSMDRGHRSNVAGLLEKEFPDRQIILLTHDREWFFELSRFLKRPRWDSSILLPWLGPADGIRFANNADDFAKARAKVDSDPEDAHSNIRRIMDQALAEIAERLEITMPYLRGDGNDHRTAGQFIGRITGQVKKSFYLRNDTSGSDSAEGTYGKNTAATAALEAATPLLAAWANRGTHTFSASSDEARVLIDSCEAALNAFNCLGCDTPVYFSTLNSNDRLECRCGKLQWRP
jgi:DNA repair exonuclease SbcCD ATPase subunit